MRVPCRAGLIAVCGGAVMVYVVLTAWPRGRRGGLVRVP